MQATTISNSLGEDNVNISEWVLDKGLKKISNSKLINPSPQLPNDKAFAELQKLFAQEYPKWRFPAASRADLKQHARYQYTYVPGYTPVDVFELKVDTDAGPATVYFEVNANGTLFPTLGTELPVGPLPKAYRAG